MGQERIIYSKESCGVVFQACVFAFERATCTRHQQRKSHKLHKLLDKIHHITKCALMPT